MLQSTGAGETQKAPFPGVIADHCHDTCARTDTYIFSLGFLQAAFVEGAMKKWIPHNLSKGFGKQIVNSYLLIDDTSHAKYF